MSGDIDFVTPSELEEMATYIQTEQADDRKRITQLEDKIELLESVIENFNSASTLVVTNEGIKETPEGKAARLYKELEIRGHMKSGDVKKFFGFQHYPQATRIMDKVEELYDNVVSEKTLGKGHRGITLLKKEFVNSPFKHV